MGNVTTSKDLTGSTLLTVRDIGPDGLLGTGDDGQFTGKGDIGAIMIGGTMSGTTIAANVNPVNGIFGDGDDIALASSLEGAIKSLTVKGALIGSADTAGEHFGVVAHKALGALKISATSYKGPWTQGMALGNLTVKDNLA